MLARTLCPLRATIPRLLGSLAALALIAVSCSTSAEPVAGDQLPATATSQPTAQPTAVPTTAPSPTPEPTSPPVDERPAQPAPTATASPEPEPEAATARTRTGAEVLADDDFVLLAGQRVGLITHRPSVVDGRRLADLMTEHPDVDLVALFAPEHGLDGTGAAGENLADSTDTATGVPVFSLYGVDRSPNDGTLDGVDVLVYDLQDVGARFFTYTSTLGLSMQAAADAGIPFVVLDRPNPLGGNVLQGPALKEGIESFIGLYPIPSAYGLTSGELALVIKERKLLPGLEDLELQIVEMRDWQRGQVWADTGLDWIAPSPNLPTADAALLYPGTVLFEATSISEGRGTDTPFELIGAPWVDADALAASMNELGLSGVRFEPATFTPRSIPEAAPNPRYLGQELHGVRIQVVDSAEVRGLEVGFHLLDAIVAQRVAEVGGIDQVDIIDRPEVFDRLVGRPIVRVEFWAGTPIDDIIASFEPDHQAFSDLISDLLLY